MHTERGFSTELLSYVLPAQSGGKKLDEPINGRNVCPKMDQSDSLSVECESLNGRWLELNFSQLHLSEKVLTALELRSSGAFQCPVFSSPIDAKDYSSIL